MEPDSFEVLSIQRGVQLDLNPNISESSSLHVIISRGVCICIRYVARMGMEGYTMGPEHGHGQQRVFIVKGVVPSRREEMIGTCLKVCTALRSIKSPSFF